MLFLARVWPVVVVGTEAIFSTPPPIFTWMVELGECKSAFVCVAVARAAAEGDSGDFGGDESSGEELQVARPPTSTSRCRPSAIDMIQPFPEYNLNSPIQHRRFLGRGKGSKKVWGSNRITFFPEGGPSSVLVGCKPGDDGRRCAESRRLHKERLPRQRIFLDRGCAQINIPLTSGCLQTMHA